MGIRAWALERWFGDLVDERVHNAVKVVDDRYWREMNTPAGARRGWGDVRGQLERVQELCRTNPLAARLVGMTTDFVIGHEVRMTGDAFARAFWDHPQNRLGQRRMIRGA